MTASQISRLLRGKRTGHGKYIARCPAHDDKTPSLSIRDGKDAVLLKCWPGCSAKEIVSAMGLKMSDLWYSSDAMTPEVSGRLKDERRLELLDRQLGLAMMAQTVLTNERHYWAAVEKRIQEDRKNLIFKLYPERKQAYDLQCRIRELGWERLWDDLLRENPRIERANPIVQELQTSLF